MAILGRLLCTLGLLLPLGSSCGGGGGGSGGGGSAPVISVSTPDERCLALPGNFPPAFTFLSSSQAAVLNFQPPALIPVALNQGLPTVLASGGVNLGAAGQEACPTTPLTPQLDGLLLLDSSLALLSASGCEGILFVDPRDGSPQEVRLVTPPSVGALDYPEWPAPGSEEIRRALSTFACLRPPTTVDSRGDAISLSLCDAGVSFFSGFTAGVAVAADRLFVVVSNLAGGAGSDDPQFLPGAVLVFEWDRSVDPPTVTPDTSTPVIFTSGFNPTEVRRMVAGSGRELLLVVGSGAVGLQVDDSNTPAIEGGGVAKTDAFIDVIDAANQRLVATIPMGLLLYPRNPSTLILRAALHYLAVPAGVQSTGWI